MKTLARKPYLAAGLCCMTLLFCAQLSTNSDGDGEPAVLRLSLEEVGRSEAEFSGAPIEAIIELDVDTPFHYLHWHTGKGNLLYPDTILDDKAKRFSIQLFWKEYPQVLDTVEDNYFDTVWVTMGGGLKRSNKVRVEVTNLPVVIDSIRLDSILFLGQDTVWNCSLPVVLEPSYMLYLYARDLDGKTPEVEVLGNRGKVILDDIDLLNMIYEPLEGDFIDSMDIIVYDQKGGQAIRKLVIVHMTPNILPFIDSIRIASTMLRGTSGNRYQVGFRAFDTLQIRLYAHDSLGTIEDVYWDAEENLLVPDTASALRAVYICTTETFLDTVDDTSYAADEITITVRDNRGDSTTAVVQLFHGKLNELPVIEKIFIGEDEVALSGALTMIEVSGGLRYVIRLEAKDPEGEELAVSWSAGNGSALSGKSDTAAFYRTPSESDTDTVTVSVSDGKSTVTGKIGLMVNDIAPRLDSITVDDTTLTGDDTLYSIIVFPYDTLLVIAYVEDFDDEDEVSYQWSAGNSDRFNIKVDNRSRYVLPATELNDTIIITVQDGEAQLVRYIELIPGNQKPVIDSILHDSVRLTGMNLYLSDTAHAADTVRYRVFARDPEGDNVSCRWSCLDSTFFTSLTGEQTEYICGDSLYDDTLSVTVEDNEGARTLKMIYLFIDTTVTP